MIILIGLMVAITRRRRAEVMRLTKFVLRADGITRSTARPRLAKRSAPTWCPGRPCCASWSARRWR